MKKILSIPDNTVWLAVLILLFLIASEVYAAPMPQRTVVNHKTHQCAQITPGDECGDVVLPLDWEYLDPSQGEKCPDGYQMVELRPAWSHFKVQHCCMEGHSGSSGDCQDVIIDQDERQCAFVDDLRQCTSLPEGWQIWSQNCPAGFSWSDDFACVIGASSPAETVAPAMSTQPAPTSQPTQAPPTPRPDVRNPLFPCGSAGIALLALFSLGFHRLLSG
jgi:hypothetical protein